MQRRQPRTISPCLVAAAMLLAAGCGADHAGQGSDTVARFPTAATLGPQTPEPVAAYLSREPLASADRALGNRLMAQCRACHSVDKGGPHMLGPNLYGVFGRQAGSVEGYGFTAALKNANFVWTPRALDAWLALPTRFLPGNAMAFGGIPHEADRTALIASLLRQSTAEDE